MGAARSRRAARPRPNPRRYAASARPPAGASPRGPAEGDFEGRASSRGAAARARTGRSPRDAGPRSTRMAVPRSANRRDSRTASPGRRARSTRAARHRPYPVPSSATALAWPRGHGRRAPRSPGETRGVCFPRARAAGRDREPGSTPWSCLPWQEPSSWRGSGGSRAARDSEPATLKPGSRAGPASAGGR